MFYESLESSDTHNGILLKQSEVLKCIWLIKFIENSHLSMSWTIKPLLNVKFISRECDNGFVIIYVLNVFQGSKLKEFFGCKDGPLIGKINDILLRWQYRHPGETSVGAVEYLKSIIDSL